MCCQRRMGHKMMRVWDANRRRKGSLGLKCGARLALALSLLIKWHRQPRNQRTQHSCQRCYHLSDVRGKDVTTKKRFGRKRISTKYKCDLKKLVNRALKSTGRVFHALRFTPCLVFGQSEFDLELKAKHKTHRQQLVWDRVIKSEGRSVFTAAASFNLDEPSY